MGRSSTWCVRSVSSILDAREQRQAALSRALSERRQTRVFLSLNVPGENKVPAGSSALFSWALRETLALCSSQSVESSHEVFQDALGPCAIIAIGSDPLEFKRLAVALETSQAAARLVDIDVYDDAGRQVGRRELGLPARPCLLCEQSAVDCIRAKRHPVNEVIAKTYELLSNFSA